MVGSGCVYFKLWPSCYKKKIVERLWDANNDVVDIISSHRWASVAAFSAS